MNQHTASCRIGTVENYRKAEEPDLIWTVLVIYTAAFNRSLTHTFAQTPSDKYIHVWGETQLL